jgi:hypothetical protein
MPKKTPLREVCPLDTAVEALGGKWKPPDCLPIEERHEALF